MKLNFVFLLFFVTNSIYSQSTFNIIDLQYYCTETVNNFEFLLNRKNYQYWPANSSQYRRSYRSNLANRSGYKEFIGRTEVEGKPVIIGYATSELSTYNLIRDGMDAEGYNLVGTEVVVHNGVNVQQIVFINNRYKVYLYSSKASYGKTWYYIDIELLP